MTISAFIEIGGNSIYARSNHAMLYHAKKCEMKSDRSITWLSFSDKNDNSFDVFMPIHVAEAMADAWTEAQDVEPEPVDAGAVAARTESTNRQIAEAGRGPLIGDES